MTIRLLGMTAGLTVGNYIAQYLLNAPDWSVAIDRSVFQALAMFCVWISFSLKPEF